VSKKPLASSTAHSQRRRKPIFVDEPIQWHLTTDRHDRCPWCGLQTLQARGPRGRWCQNEVCEIHIEIPFSAKEWLQRKTSGSPINYNGPEHFSISTRDDVAYYTLRDAQLMSNTGRATLCAMAGFDAYVVYWHKDGHLPELKSGHRCCAGGSPYWEFLRDHEDHPVWLPEDPMCAMEVIAKAANDDLNFCIMRP
jgi:hypothetical protein